MNNVEKYQKWLEAAQDDLESAEIMNEKGKYSYVAFMCQQAIEKLSKGIYVLILNEEAPYTHNIIKVLNGIDKITNSKDYDKYKELFGELTSYYIVGRYDVYKEKISRNLDKLASSQLLKKSKEAFLWLQSQQK